MRSRLWWAVTALAIAPSGLAIGAQPVLAKHAVTPDSPLSVDLLAALECRIEAPAYMNFALNLGDGSEGYAARKWKKVESSSPLFTRYELPAPITISGYTTSTIMFDASGVMAVLDAEPAEIGAKLGIDNQKYTPVRFRGEKPVYDKVIGDGDTRFSAKASRLLQNIPTMPGKALLGCSYVESMM